MIRLRVPLLSLKGLVDRALVDAAAAKSADMRGLR
jgi:hypothetical protein